MTSVRYSSSLSGDGLKILDDMENWDYEARAIDLPGYPSPVTHHLYFHRSWSAGDQSEPHIFFYGDENGHNHALIRHRGPPGHVFQNLDAGTLVHSGRLRHRSTHQELRSFSRAEVVLCIGAGTVLCYAACLLFGANL